MSEESLPLNDVYREIADELGMDAAKTVYRIFRGQQITFPQRFFRPDKVREIIRLEYDGNNIRELARKYDYSEKTVRRMIREQPESEAEQK